MISFCANSSLCCTNKSLDDPSKQMLFPTVFASMVNDLTLTLYGSNEYIKTALSVLLTG